MAKVDRPLFADEARGRIGVSLSFQKRKVFATVCPQFSRRESKTKKVVNKRNKFASCCRLWRALDDVERVYYIDNAPSGWTSYQFFISLCLKDIL